MRDVYLTEKVGEARTLLKKAIVGCKSDEVPEIRSLGDTLERWQSEILNHHRTGASNGPTEGMNLCLKRIKRAGHGFTSFKHYAEPAGPTSRRRCDLAQAPITAGIRTRVSLLQRIEPVKSSVQSSSVLISSHR